MKRLPMVTAMITSTIFAAPVYKGYGSIIAGQKYQHVTPQTTD